MWLRTRIFHITGGVKQKREMLRFNDAFQENVDARLNSSELPQMETKCETEGDIQRDPNAI